MGVRNSKTEWYCVDCSKVLGHMVGGELQPEVDGKFIRTNGPNLNITCPECGSVKVFYTSDPVVRAVYQLVNAVSSVSAKSMIQELSRYVNNQQPK